MKLPDFWVYILHCVNDSYYTGYTANLCQRYRAHRKGAAAKYTRSFPPKCLASAWPVYGTKREAMQIERFIKKLDKSTKQNLIEYPHTLEHIFYGTPIP